MKNVLDLDGMRIAADVCFYRLKVGYMWDGKDRPSTYIWIESAFKKYYKKPRYGNAASFPVNDKNDYESTLLQAFCIIDDLESHWKKRTEIIRKERRTHEKA